MDFFNSGLPLGRWFRVQVTLSWFFLMFFAYEMWSEKAPAATVEFFGVILVIVLLHEFGHVITCRLTKGHADQIVITLLGGYTVTQSPPSPWAHLVTAFGGPLVHIILLGPLWAAARFLPEFAAVPPTAISIIRYAWIINYILLALNLFPFYPLDGGRMLQAILWFFVGPDRATVITGMVGTVGGASLVVIGLGIFNVHFPGVFGEIFNIADYWIAIIGAIIAMQSFGAYQAAQRRLSQRH